MTNKEVFSTNKKLFDYLYLKQDPKKADAVIGFGHFDMKIPARCAELYEMGLAEKIIFTGGIGAGTADLGSAEADTFLAYLQKHYPHIKKDNILIENQSTNTGENLRYSIAKVKEEKADWSEKLMKGTLLLVANPFRQRRVFLTTAQILPHANLINCPPNSSYEEELVLFKTKQQNLNEQLPGEIKRIIEYPKKGWIKEEKVPQDILKLIDPNL